MINLLPPEEKERLLLERRKTMVIIIWVAFLFFLFSFFLILILVNVYLQTQIISQKSILEEIERESQKAEIQNLLEKVNSANKNLEKLESFYKQKIYFIGILEKVSNTLPSGLNLVSFSISPPKISLSGFALSRENLFEFKNNIEKESSFKDAYFPPANWVKPNNIDFVVTFDISL